MVIASTFVPGGQIDQDAFASQVALHVTKNLRAEALVVDRTSDREPLEQALDHQVDQYRDLLREGSAETALRLLLRLLDDLPAGASGKIRFRIKANIGHCYIQKGDFAEAQRWLLESYDLAPAERAAVASKALAFILADRFLEAVEVCRAALTADPANDLAASYLFQAAIPLSEIADPLQFIPAELREKEEVAIAQALFLRGRERHPEWWTVARQAARRYPENERIALFAAESFVEEAIRHPEFELERKVASGLREPLLSAASTLDEHWQKIRRSEVPARSDALSALVDAMIAHQVLGHFVRAVELARDVVDHATDEQSLTNAFQIAQSSDEHELATRALDAISGPSARVMFFRALLYLEQNEWNQAAECLADADVPASERKLAATVMRLTPLREGKSDANEAEFRQVLEVASGDPRSLVTLARVARFRGFAALAEEAQKAALGLIGPGSSLMTRAMVGAYFADQGDASATIDVLDGHVPLDRPSRELEWLADTHASERPVRQRNLAFFESLPSEVAALPMYARAYGSVLLDTGSPAAAEQHLRAAVAANSDDTFAVLRLLETLRRLGRDAEADAFVRGAREYDLRGPSEHRMAFAHQLLDVGEPGRALRFACELVREHSENPRIATGYFALILEDREQNIIPTSPVVAVDTWVSVKSAHGDHNAFIIDSGKPFLGIDVLPPEHAFVGRLCSV